MNAATASMPRPPGRARAGSVRSFALALAVHGLLFGLLFFGIRWQSRPPAVVEAELWIEPPRPAIVSPPSAPAAPPRETAKVEPPPPKPDIAIREEIRKPEPRRDDKPKAEPKPDERPKAEPRKEAAPVDDPVKADLIKEELRREAARELQKEAQARDAASAVAAQSAKAVAEWNARVSAKVRSHIPVPVADAVAGNPEALFEVSLLPTLEVVGVRLVKSSGNRAYDEAAERAIKAASPLPPPASERVTPPRVLNLRMRPKDL